ncbi:hypothetical protein KAU11_09460 [Candidatus Babeliales bacterium]|nr:hypothetical protein [Candidatus Babeliales bacterium]
MLGKDETGDKLSKKRQILNDSADGIAITNSTGFGEGDNNAVPFNIFSPNLNFDQIIKINNYNLQ